MNIKRGESIGKRASEPPPNRAMGDFLLRIAKTVYLGPLNVWLFGLAMGRWPREVDRSALLSARMKNRLISAVGKARTTGGWTIVTFQDGQVDSLEPNILFYDKHFSASDSHGDMVTFLYDTRRLSLCCRIRPPLKKRTAPAAPRSSPAAPP